MAWEEIDAMRKVQRVAKPTQDSMGQLMKDGMVSMAIASLHLPVVQWTQLDGDERMPQVDRI